MVLEEVAVWTTFNKQECRYLIPEGQREMLVKVQVNYGDLVDSQGRIKHWDSICLEVIARSPPMENDGRLGEMKNGNVSFTIKEFIQAVPQSDQDVDPTQALVKSITVKTYQNCKTGVAFPVISEQLYPFLQRLGQCKTASGDPVDNPLSVEAERVLVEFVASKEHVDPKTKQPTQQYLLEKTGASGFMPGMENLIVFMFEDTRMQPVTNFFFTPTDRTTDHGDLHLLYASLFRRAALYYGRFMGLSKAVKQEISKTMLDGSTLLNQLKPELRDHLANIYVMGISLLSQSLPYISDEFEESPSKQQFTEFLEKAKQVVDQGKSGKETPEQVKREIAQLWMGLIKKTVHGIESWQNIFALLCGDCEDSGNGIQMMHSFFIKYINSERSLCPGMEFPMPMMARIGLEYMCVATLASVTSARPSREDYIKDKYPTIDKRWIEDISSLGGHLFCVFVPLKEVQANGGAFHDPTKTKEIKLRGIRANTMAHRLHTTDYSDLPALVGEGTGPGFPAPSAWRHTYKYSGKDESYWEQLQANAVIDSKASASLMAKLGCSTGSSTMFSRECSNDKVTGNYFYRQVGLCFTGLNYLYSGSDCHVPNAFVWVNTPRNQIGGTLTEITYKRDTRLVTLNDFYSPDNKYIDDPTQSPQWKVFHHLRHFMRPIQVPKNCPTMVAKDEFGNCSGKSFSWFFHPRDFGKEMRCRLTADLQAVLENYRPGTGTNGKYQLDHIQSVNGFSITDPAVYYAQMCYPGNTEGHMDRMIGRVEVVIYYE